MAGKEPKRTLKQEKWLAAYLEHGNATQATVDAGYRCKNRAIAQAIGTENLLKPVIAGALAIQRAEIRERTGITVELQQYELVQDIESARRAGAWGAVMTGRATLLRSIGGMTGNRPHPEAVARKEVDIARLREYAAILEEGLERRYNCIDSHESRSLAVQEEDNGADGSSSGCTNGIIDSASGLSGTVCQTVAQGIDDDFREGPPP